MINIDRLEMSIYFPNSVLKIPETSQSSISTDTPQTAFTRKHFSDIKKETAAVHTIAQLIPWEAGDVVAEGMAGCGFSAKAIEEASGNKVKLILNDLSDECYKTLQRNFPKASITCKDIFNWEPNNSKLIFIDFNNFTLKRIEHWEKLIHRLSAVAPYLMITDSACFGFRMGNLKSYQVNTPMEYYQKLERRLNLKGKTFSHFCCFGNAALVMFSPEKNICPQEVVAQPFPIDTKKRKRGFFQ